MRLTAVALLLWIALPEEVSAQNAELSYLMNSKWSQWSPWSFCSNSVRVRVRACATVRGFRCVGHNKEFESCEDQPKPKEGIDYDTPDPWNEDRKIAMRQLYQDYDSGVPDIRPSVKPPRMRTRPAGTRPPQITKKTNILEEIPGAIKGVVDLSDEPTTTPLPPTAKTAATTTPAESTTTFTTTPEPRPPAIDDGKDYKAPGFLPDTRATPPTAKKIRRPTPRPVALAEPTAEQAENTFNKPPQPIESVDGMVLSVEQPRETLENKSFALGRSFKNAEKGRPSPIPTIQFKDPLSDVFASPESTDPPIVLPPVPSSTEVVTFESATEESVEPSSTTKTTTEAVTTIEPITERKYNLVDGFDIKGLDDRLSEFSDLKTDAPDLTETPSTTSTKEEFSADFSPKLANATATDKPPEQTVPTLPPNIVVVAPRNPSARPKSFRERPPPSRPSRIRSYSRAHPLGKDGNAIKENDEKLAVIASPPEQETKYRVAELNGRNSERQKKTSVPVSDLTAKTINNTIAKIGNIIQKLELEAKSLAHTSTESSERVDLSKMSSEERKIFLETKALEGKLKNLQNNVEHETHNIHHHHHHKEQAEGSSQQDVLEGDTARALSWMIANMTKELGEEGNLPVVDIIPLVRVTTPPATPPKVISSAESEAEREEKSVRKILADAGPSFVDVVEPSLRDSFAIIPSDGEGREFLSSSTYIPTELVAPVLESAVSKMYHHRAAGMKQTDARNPIIMPQFENSNSRIQPESEGENDDDLDVDSEDPEASWTWSEWSEWSECNCQSQMRKRVCLPNRTRTEMQRDDRKETAVVKKKEIVPMWKRHSRHARSADDVHFTNCPSPQHQSQECDSGPCSLVML